MSVLSLLFLLPFQPKLTPKAIQMTRKQMFLLLGFCALWMVMAFSIQMLHITQQWKMRILTISLELVGSMLLILLRDTLLFPLWSKWLGLPVERKQLIRLLVLRMAFMVFWIGLGQTVYTLLTFPILTKDAPITVPLAQLAEGPSQPFALAQPFALDALGSAFKFWVNLALVFQISVMTGRSFWKVLLIAAPYVVLVEALTLHLKYTVRALQGLPIPL